MLCLRLSYGKARLQRGSILQRIALEVNQPGHLAITCPPQVFTYSDCTSVSMLNLRHNLLRLCTPCSSARRLASSSVYTRNLSCPSFDLEFSFLCTLTSAFYFCRCAIKAQ